MSADNNYPFVRRRGMGGGYTLPTAVSGGVDRRSFTDVYEGLSPGAMELAQAIDSYKIQQRRRFITYEEMLAVVLSLGYSK